MSATSGWVKPAARKRARISFSAAAAALFGAVMRMISQPASARRMACATVAATSCVGSRHRLHPDGVVPAHADAAHVHDAGEAADRAVAGRTIVRGHGVISTPLPAAVNERQKSQRWEEGTHW